jgi:hypothetical protein
MPNIHPHVLRDYALIADGERGAVVSPRGDIVWLCADCPAEVEVLLDLRAGFGKQALQTSEKVDDGRPDNLYEAMDGQGGRDHGAHGAFDSRWHSRSAQVWLDEHTAGLAGVAAGATVVAGVAAGQRAWRRGRR